MHLHILVSLLFLSSCLSCQQNQETGQASANDVVLQSSFGGIPELEKNQPTASNIIYKSEDGGQTWQDVSAGLPVNLSVGRVFSDGNAITLTTAHALYSSNTTLAAPNWEKEIFAEIEISDIFGSKSGPYISSYNNGFYKTIPGTNVLMPLHNALKDKTIRTILEARDGALFVGCESGLFKSMDDGKNWKQVLANMGINSLAESEGVLISGTHDGLLRSTDGGEHWDKVLTEDFGAWKTQNIEGGLIVITDGGSWKDGARSNRLRISTDQGKTWQRIDGNLSLPPFMHNMADDMPANLRINDIVQVGKHLFCCTNAGIFRSADLGKNWELVRLSSEKEVFELAGSGQVIFAIQVAGC